MAVAPQHLIRRTGNGRSSESSSVPLDDLEWFGPTWILGKFYDGNTQPGRRHLKRDIQSRLLMTYRKNFSPIGGTELTSDKGWGCMLRCGQMLLAQALLCLWVGRDWLWDPTARESECDRIYQKILEQFLDLRSSLYSVHAIAQMGVSEGKMVGEWFGPNTVAQVLKRLSVFDDFTPYCVHVAMDNTVVIEDIYKMCQALPFMSKKKRSTNVDDGTPEDDLTTASANHILVDDFLIASSANQNPAADDVRCKSSDQSSSSSFYKEKSSSGSFTSATGRHRNVTLPVRTEEGMKKTWNQEDSEVANEKTVASVGAGTGAEVHCLNKWRPILLFIPLRLGLTEINADYVDAIKECFHMEETMGIIGGRPNSAYYFIGYQGNYLLYLDPHDTKPCVTSEADDVSYHCESAKRMPFSALDPSLAIAFLLQSQAQFEKWCSEMSNSIITERKQPMFEIVQKRPSHWPPLEVYPCLTTQRGLSEDVGAGFHHITDSELSEVDEGFVVL